MRAMEGLGSSDVQPRFCRGQQRKAAIINDFSGFGRCSLMASVPVLSAMGIQCCPVPTSLFTSHTGFPKFSKLDCTDWMAHYLDDWKAIGLGFEAIQSGYLVSCAQLDFVRDFVAAFRRPGTLVAVDPVMGDYGRLYPSYDPALAARMPAPCFRTIRAVSSLLRYSVSFVPSAVWFSLITRPRGRISARMP